VSSLLGHESGGVRKPSVSVSSGCCDRRYREPRGTSRAALNENRSRHRQGRARDDAAQHVTYLSAAIQSLQHQTYGDFGLVLVDDESSGTTWYVVQGFWCFGSASRRSVPRGSGCDVRSRWQEATFGHRFSDRAGNGPRSTVSQVIPEDRQVLSLAPSSVVTRIRRLRVQRGLPAWAIAGTAHGAGDGPGR